MSTDEIKQDLERIRRAKAGEWVRVSEEFMRECSAGRVPEEEIVRQDGEGHGASSSVIGRGNQSI